MLKSQIAARMNLRHPHLNKAECVEIINAFFRHIEAHLIAGGSVEFRDFGRFTVKRYDPRTARNPRTGEKVVNVTVAAVMFRTGKSLHTLLNPAK